MYTHVRCVKAPIAIGIFDATKIHENTAIRHGKVKQLSLGSSKIVWSGHILQIASGHVKLDKAICSHGWTLPPCYCSIAQPSAKIEAQSKFFNLSSGAERYALYRFVACRVGGIPLVERNIVSPHAEIRRTDTFGVFSAKLIEALIGIVGPNVSAR
jgi:hypothetical protein